MIITLDFHFGLKKCTDASSVVIVWKDADIKEALTPSFSPVFPQQIFYSVLECLLNFEGRFLGEEKMHFLLQFCGVVTQNFK